MAELNVSRKTISKLLLEIQGKVFLVPEYQRPYSWDEERCETLWNDITEFHLKKNEREEYFLGTIVTCKSNVSENAIEIIDGQQRITSLLLLLRAFYKKLENMPLDDNIAGLRGQIEPCIWDVDSISRKVKDRTKIHIQSKVVTDSDNEVFHSILRDGTSNQKRTDLYTTNYAFFLSKCEEYARDFPMHWQPLCVTILEKCIVLPIECESEDTALTIFSTLNDRGMPLSDSDIFKAQIYSNKNTPETKRKFTENWRELTEMTEASRLSIDDLFRYYSHVIRAQAGDKTKEIGLRKFYETNNYSRLKEEKVIDELKILAEFWRAVQNGESAINGIELINSEAKKYLHCLQWYPNEYWRYVTSVYYLTNLDSKTLIDEFPVFLKRLVAFLFVKFIEKPTVNAIRDDIFIGCIDVSQKKNLNWQHQLHDGIPKMISSSSESKISRALILLHAYLNQKQEKLIPNDFEVEHIFPRKWQNTNYNGWDLNDAEVYLNKFGNKAPIEKKVNIQAGNGYFGKKRTTYQKSKIAEIQELSSYPSVDWNKEDIEKREQKILDNLMAFFKANL